MTNTTTPVVTAAMISAREAMTETPEAAAKKMIEHLDHVRCEPTEPSEQRKKYETIAAQISVGKASQDDAVQAILALCRDNERLAVISGKSRAERDAAIARAEAAEARVAELEAMPTRKTFPILNGSPARVDWQLVADHAQQAMANHGQSVQTLANRGGLSWCELFAVLHNRRWEKIDTNDAMIACRALEARYLAAMTPPADLAKGGGE